MHFYYYYVEDTAEIRTCISYVVERNTAANTILPSVNCVTTKWGFLSLELKVFRKSRQQGTMKYFGPLLPL